MSKEIMIDGTFYHIHEEREGRHGGTMIFYYHAGGNIIRRLSVHDDVMENNGFGYYNKRNGYHNTAQDCVK
jgi:hypothetical protein